MAAGKEIRTQIKSVQSTQKITRAMQMVATSKMRKTQDRMRQARPYADKVREVMAHLAQATEKSASPFLRIPAQTKRVGIILITADKGLCGGLNTNAIKLFAEKLRDYKDQNVEVEVCTLGQKGLVAANRLKVNVVSSAVSLGDVPQMEKLIGPLTGIFRDFHDEKLDAVYVVYSKFVNTMKQQPIFEQILPLSDRDLRVESKYPWDYIYEPSAEEVLNQLVRRYLESVIYQCLADNMASEQASRMIAMRSATDNAGEAIHQLSLAYNKSRQAAITKELAEICAGAAAV
ncbi:MAG: F0F1 ATP synthase subunit gamma [Proteobacteria bacterium]|nr:MAG: F0F1 ATP synthase subunit gamma [Pseudomonadota bacterium]